MQSRSMSALESLLDTLAGLVTAVVAQIVFLPLLYGIPATAAGTSGLTAVFTGMAAGKRYVFRRLFTRSTQQSRQMSAIESVVDTSTGLALQMLAQVVFLPLFYGVPATPAGTVGLTAACAGLAALRRYLLRRLFEARARTRRSWTTEGTSWATAAGQE
jgi:hypothetical protein